MSEGATFRHGVHPAEHKERTEHLPIERMPFVVEFREDVDLAPYPIEVVFQRDNFFDRSSMEWTAIVAATKRGTDVEAERFLYIGQAPPELRDAYKRPIAQAR